MGALLAWPYLREYETAMWHFNEQTCSERFVRNQQLIELICDRGLAQVDTVNCELARVQNAWPVWVCVVWNRLHGHSAVALFDHLRASWFVSVFVIVVAVVLIKYWMQQRTEVAKHRIDREVFIQQASAYRPFYDRRSFKQLEEPSSSKRFLLPWGQRKQ